MAETFDDDFKAEMLDFKAQMMRFVTVAEQKFDGLASDVRDNSFRIEKVEQKLGGVEEKLSGVEHNLSQKIDALDRKLSSKLDQVTEKVIDHEKRLRGFEREGATSPTVN